MPPTNSPVDMASLLQNAQPTGRRIPLTLDDAEVKWSVADKLPASTPGQGAASTTRPAYQGQRQTAVPSYIAPPINPKFTPPSLKQQLMLASQTMSDEEFAQYVQSLATR